MGSLVDLTNKRFGRWTVIERAENTKRGQPRWLCKCDCGNVAIVQGNTLKSGQSQSCGCYQKEQNIKAVRKHDKSRTRIYHIWQGMRYRCENEKTVNYENYGGRGITVCEEWREFAPFYDWAMANGYADNLTIDRINTNGNYEPSNCRWSTQKEQCNNMRKNVVISYNGDSKTVKQWADELGMKSSTLWSRIFRYHWTTEKAFTQPVKVCDRSEKYCEM